MENEALLNLRSLSISNDDKKVVLVQSGRTKESNSTVDIYNLLDIFLKNSGELSIPTFESLIHLDSQNSQKYVSAKFTKNDDKIYLSRDDGTIELIELNEKKNCCVFESTT